MKSSVYRVVFKTFNKSHIQGDSLSLILLKIMSLDRETNIPYIKKYFQRTMCYLGIRRNHYSLQYKIFMNVT